VKHPALKSIRCITKTCLIRGYSRHQLADCGHDIRKAYTTRNNAQMLGFPGIRRPGHADISGQIAGRIALSLARWTPGTSPARHAARAHTPRQPRLAAPATGSSAHAQASRQTRLRLPAIVLGAGACEPLNTPANTRSAATDSWPNRSFDRYRPDSHSSSPLPRALGHGRQVGTASGASSPAGSARSRFRGPQMQRRKTICPRIARGDGGGEIDAPPPRLSRSLGSPSNLIGCTCHLSRS
jgi:hypothetical protein